MNRWRTCHRGRPAAQGYQHQGIGNQPGTIFYRTYAAGAPP
nr:MAG TPA: hypothetical protein [Caudoviricetes sp.]